MDITQRITDLITPSLESMGYEVVRVLVSGSHRPVLQVMIERKDQAPVTVEDCAKVSRTAAALLDVENPIPGSYQLEVSSPGLDRPLTRLQDYTRFKGQEARIEVRAPIDGRRRFQGLITGLEQEDVKLETPEGLFRLPFGDISKARLMPPDVKKGVKPGQKTKNGMKKKGLR